MLATLLFCGCNIGFDESLGIATSMIGNVGVSIGQWGSSGCYAALPAVAKWAATFVMLIGRLEIFTILLFIACVMACLAALCLVLPHHITIGEKEVRWPTLAEVMEREEAYTQPLPEEEESIIDPDTIAPSPDTIVPEKSAEKPKPVIPKVAVDSTTDSRQFLPSFYAALQKSGERKVRVMHYGDSQIEEDRMTMQIREQLQKQYGGRGVGLMPLLQTIPTRTTRQELRMNGRLIGPSQAQQGPKRYLVYGFKRDQREDGMYGAMGQVAWMNDSLVSGSEDLIAMCKPQSASAHYDEWRIFADTSIRYTTSGDTVHLMGRRKSHRCHRR